MEKTTKMAVKKSILCPECNGKGGKGDVKKCLTCDGQGKRLGFRQFGPGLVQQVAIPCSDCMGEGEIIKEKDRCGHCRSAKIVEQKKIFEVYIDKGMHNKHKITFSGEGDQMPGIIPGDIVLSINEKEHPIFKRSGDDLIMNKELTLCEALCGFEFQLIHLDKRIIHIHSLPNRVIEPNDTMCVEGEGMPYWRDPFTKGRLVITFSVKFPASLEITPSIAKTLRTVLPHPPPIPKNASTKLEDAPEEVHMSEMNDKKSSSSRNSNYHNDDDDEQDLPQGARIGCAQQ